MMKHELVVFTLHLTDFSFKPLFKKLLDVLLNLLENRRRLQDFGFIELSVEPCEINVFKARVARHVGVLDHSDISIGGQDLSQIVCCERFRLCIVLCIILAVKDALASDGVSPADPNNV